MKLVNYKLQNQIEYLSDEKTNSFFKEYLQGILEDKAKPYYQRADYIGLSLNEIKNKIDTLASDISELQTLKKRLSNATSKTKDEIIIKNEDALINLGYVKFSVDYEAIEKALTTKEGRKELKKYVDVIPITVSAPAKIKVNTKRTSANNVEAVETDEILVIEEQIENYQSEKLVA